jgi:predicted enzyme related to lactoylglutathione lyase
MSGARIDYVELPSATAHELTRAFYSKAFGWDFTDYGRPTPRRPTALPISGCKAIPRARSPRRCQ